MFAIRGPAAFLGRGWIQWRFVGGPFCRFNGAGVAAAVTYQLVARMGLDHLLIDALCPFCMRKNAANALEKVG